MRRQRNARSPSAGYWPDGKASETGICLRQHGCWWLGVSESRQSEWLLTIRRRLLPKERYALKNPWCNAFQSFSARCWGKPPVCDHVQQPRGAISPAGVCVSGWRASTTWKSSGRLIMSTQQGQTQQAGQRNSCQSPGIPGLQTALSLRQRMLADAQSCAIGQRHVCPVLSAAAHRLPRRKVPSYCSACLRVRFVDILGARHSPAPGNLKGRAGSPAIRRGQVIDASDHLSSSGLARQKLVFLRCGSTSLFGFAEGCRYPACMINFTFLFCCS